MSPFRVISLLKSTTFVWTEYAAWASVAHQLAFSAKPLTFGDIWYAIAFLVDCKITTITEHYRIGILAITIVANSALTVRLLT